MAILSKTGITTGQTVETWHVTQSIDAFTGIEAYDISLSGSFNMTGSTNISGSIDITDVINIGNAGYINGVPILTSATITGIVTSVNGIYPINGNVTTALTAVLTGTSASLAISSSGNITGSIGEGTVWVVAGDPDPNNNGDSYIFAPGPPGVWYPIAPLDQPAADARYILKNGDDSHTGSLYISGSGISIDLLGSTRINEINDLNNNLSIDPNTRELYDSSGNVVLDWENGIFTGSMYGTASYALTSEPIASNPNDTIYSTTPLSTTYPANSSIFLGINAGSGSVSPDNSVFLGQNTGLQADFASYSVFIGATSGFSATSASYSNFIGIQAGYGALSSSYSNFIGLNAGFNASSASYSTLIGHRVGLTFSGNNIGSNNIIIGNNISLPNGARNSINIGGVIYATGSYSTTTGNPSILAQSNARVGIGTFSPTERLEVAGNIRCVNNLVTVQSTTSDANYVVDSDSFGMAYWIANFTANRTLQISNLSSGQSMTVVIRNTNSLSRTISVQASTSTSSYTNVVLSNGNNSTSTTFATLPATSGMVTIWVANIGGTFLGSIM